MKHKQLFVALGLIALLLAGTAYAQTTGALTGTVFEKEGGQPLPGVQVTITSPALQGTKTAYTDGTGLFKFREIPPGDYKVVSSLEGFGKVALEGIRVGLDRTADVRVRMSAAVTEFITVTGETPLVDVKSTTTGQNMTEEVLQALPLGRNFTAALRVVPSAQADGQGFSMNGATSGENSYIVDGVETTEVERGRQGKQINMEFVQEVEVKTGGYEAEFGRAAGGVVNVITKAGGNEFHGDLFAYYEDDSLSEDFDGKDADQDTAASYAGSFTRKDYGLAMGGYIMKDTLWFFAAYDIVKNEQDTLISDSLRQTFPELKSSYMFTTDRDLRSAKLTWNINENHNVVFSLFGDPTTDEGALGTVAGEESTFMAGRDRGGDDYTLKYLGILSPKLFLNLQGARHKEESIIKPQSEDILYLDRTGAYEIRSGGLGYVTESKFNRDQYKGDLNLFLDAAGSHDIKLGVDMEKLSADKLVRYTGGQLIWAFPCGTRPCVAGGPYDSAGHPIYFGHEIYVNKGTTVSTIAENYLPGGIGDKPETNNFSVFLQDSWDLGKSFTLKVGLRWEKQALANEDGREWIKLTDNYAPRLGFVWDPTNTGTQKLSGSYGRYFQNIPMDINIRFMGAEADAYVYNQSLTSLDPNGVRASRTRGTLSTLDGLEAAYGIVPVDPNLKGQSVDEFSLGYETQVDKWSFGGTLIYKKLNRVIEDGGAVITDADGNPAFVYVVGNPGEGTMMTAPNLAYTDAFSIPKPKREYKALQLTAQRKMSDNWGLFASYVYSKTQGNYDGTYQRSTGQIDPMINSAFDYYDFNVVWTPTCVMDGTCKTLDGYLSNDRRHQAKVDIYYTAQLGPGSLTASASPYYMSGRPKTKQGWSDIYRNNELSLSNRGGMGTMPAEYELDLGLGYQMPLGPVSFTARADVFNALNRQGITDTDMIWALTEDGNTSETPTNPNYGKPNAWQAPRFYRFSLKFSF
jgi:hypothetical protein